MREVDAFDVPPFLREREGVDALPDVAVPQGDGECAPIHRPARPIHLKTTTSQKCDAVPRRARIQGS